MQTISQKKKYFWNEYFKHRDFSELELDQEDFDEINKSKWEELYWLIEWLIEWRTWDIEDTKYDCWKIDWYKEAIVDLVNHFRDIETSEDVLWKEPKKTFTAEKIADMLERLLK